MVLIVVYNGTVLVGMTWYTDDSVPTIRDDDVVSLSVLYVGCDEIYIVPWERYEW